MKDEPFNPYAPPASESLTQIAPGGISARAAMMKHEVSVRAVALSFNILGVILLCAGILVFRLQMLSQWIAASAVVAGILCFAVEHGLRSFSNWSRIAAVILSAAFTLVFPLFLLGLLHIIPTLFNREAGTIFSDGYKEVIKATPHLDLDSSPFVRRLPLIIGVVATALICLGAKTLKM